MRMSGKEKDQEKENEQCRQKSDIKTTKKAQKVKKWIQETR